MIRRRRPADAARRHNTKGQAAIDLATNLARLALSRSGRPWGEGVSVRAPEETLLEQIANGCIHPSMIAEPNGNGNGRATSNSTRPALSTSRGGALSCSCLAEASARPSRNAGA